MVFILAVSNQSQKMKSNTVVKVGIVAVVIYFLLKKANISDYLDFNIKDISFSGDFLNPSADLILTITNKMKLPVTVTNLSGNFYLNDTTVKIGEVGTFTPVTLAAVQNNTPTPTDIDIPINLLFSGIISTLQNLLQSGSGTNIIFQGSTTFNGISIPLNLNFKS